MFGLLWKIIAFPYHFMVWCWFAALWIFFYLTGICLYICIGLFILTWAKDWAGTTELFCIKTGLYAIPTTYIFIFICSRFGGGGGTYTDKVAAYKEGVRSGRIEPTFVVAVDMDDRYGRR